MKANYKLIKAKALARKSAKLWQMRRYLQENPQESEGKQKKIEGKMPKTRKKIPESKKYNFNYDKTEEKAL